MHQKDLEKLDNLNKKEYTLKLSNLLTKTKRKELKKIMNNLNVKSFHIPKSKGKKSTGVAGKKAAPDEEEDFKIDDEFKDMFDEGDGFDDEEDDY